MDPGSQLPGVHFIKQQPSKCLAALKEKKNPPDCCLATRPGPSWVINHKILCENDLSKNIAKVTPGPLDNMN